MLFLSKLLPLFAVPLGLAILLGAVAFLAWRLRRTARLLVALAVVVLWVPSMPVVANWLTAGLEGAYPPVALDRLPQAEVAIVLGGVVGQPRPPRTEPDLGDPIDRVVDAWRVYRAGKVGAILVSGGNLPWADAPEPEAVLIKRLLVELGVPDGDIVTETQSANTRDNAVNSAPIVSAHGWTSVLLITSAMHMPRALAAFERAGIRAVPVPTDFHVAGGGDTVLDFLPDAEALGRTTSVMREWLGLLYYRLRGWA